MTHYNLDPYIAPEIPLDTDYVDRWAVHLWFAGNNYLEPDGRKWRFIDYTGSDDRDLTFFTCTVNTDTLLVTDLSQLAITQAEALEVAVTAARNILGNTAISGFMRAGMNSVDIVEKYAELKLGSILGNAQVTRQELSDVMNELALDNPQSPEPNNPSQPETLTEPPLLDVSNAASVMLQAC